MKTLLLLLLLVPMISFGQNKKEQILSLNNKVDSLNIVLSKTKDKLQSSTQEVKELNTNIKTLKLEVAKLKNDLDSSLSILNPIQTELKKYRFFFDGHLFENFWTSRIYDISFDDLYVIDDLSVIDLEYGIKHDSPSMEKLKYSLNELVLLYLDKNTLFSGFLYEVDNPNNNPNEFHRRVDVWEYKDGVNIRRLSFDNANDKDGGDPKYWLEKDVSFNEDWEKHGLEIEYEGSHCYVYFYLNGEEIDRIRIDGVKKEGVINEWDKEIEDQRTE